MMQSFSKKWVFFLAFLALLGGHGAFAEVLKDLYQVELPIDPHATTAEATNPSKEAFKALLLKMAGSKILEKPSIRKAINDPDVYVKQLSYHQNAEGQPLVRVQFNDALVDRLLKEAGTTTLGENRPLTLLWLVLEDAQGIHLVSADTDPTLLSSIEVAFKKHGVPLVLPLMDLQDQSQITAEDIRSKDFTKVQELSKRYHPEYMVLGVLKQNEGWVATWSTISEISWESKAGDQALLWDALIEHLLNQWKTQVTVPIASKQKPIIRHLTLHISGVTQAEDYAKMMRYLEKFPFVSKVAIQQIGPNFINLHFSSTLAQDKIMHAIEKDELLVPDPLAKPSLGEMFYRLRGSE